MIKYPGQYLGFKMPITPSFILQISIILGNFFYKSYGSAILQIIELSHLEAATVIYESYFIPNGTIILDTMLLPPTKLFKHI